MRVLEPQEVVIFTTNRCNAACRHCCMSSGPDREGALGGEQLERILREIHAELGPVLIVFTGGEPTLLGADLDRAIAVCHALGMPSRLVTNGFWARSREAAVVTLRRLRGVGLQEVNISTDDQHLPWISLQRVRWAYEAALEVGFRSVVLSACFGPESAVTPERLNEHLAAGAMELRYDADQQVRPAMKTPWLATAGIVSNPQTQRIGRGAHALLAHEVFADDEDLASIPGGCPWAVRAPAVTPGGHLVSCCGFELEGNPLLDYGDLAESSFAELVDRADQDLISNAIALIGPPRIKKVLETLCPDEVDFPQPRYGTYCEVCHDLVTREANRRAFYDNQAVFANAVLRMREQVAAQARGEER